MKLLQFAILPPLRVKPLFAFSCLAVGVVLSGTADAQSATRSPAASSNASAGSATKSTAGSIALEGYCPVCVIEMRKWVKGNSQFAVQQDGKTYLFPGQEQMQMFVSNPDKYTPALGGDCVVAKVETGQRVAGNIHQAVISSEGRLFLFSKAEGKEMFLKNPSKYSNADLALDGRCAVCRVEMNQDIQGSPKFVAFQDGMRYWFPGEDQLGMFNQNPTKFAVAK